MTGQRRPRKQASPTVAQVTADATEWYTLPDGRHGLRGFKDGKPVNVIADTSDELHALVKGMS